MGQKMPLQIDPLSIAGAIPAVRAQPFLGEADGRYQSVQALVFERGQVQLFADTVDHGQVLFRSGTGIFFQVSVLGAFQRLDGRAPSQVKG